MTIDDLFMAQPGSRGLRCVRALSTRSPPDGGAGPHVLVRDSNVE